MDTNKTLASATVPDSLDTAMARDGETANLQIPFVNPNVDKVKVVVTRLDDGSTNVGPIDLYRLGAASYLWTKYPRLGVKRLQKFFTTGTMLPLAVAGVVLLALARRFDVLAIILAVPLYYICSHAPLHLELRYILPLHYFWEMLVATSLYFMSVTALRLLREFKASQRKA